MTWPARAAALQRAGKGGEALRAAVKANADQHAADLAPVIADIRASGHISLRAIADQLTQRGMLTRQGGYLSARPAIASQDQTTSTALPAA